MGPVHLCEAVFAYHIVYSHDTLSWEKPYEEA